MRQNFMSSAKKRENRKIAHQSTKNATNEPEKQINEKKAKIRKQRMQLMSRIQNIDDFTKYCGEDGRFIGAPKKAPLYKVTIETPSTKKDAKAIRRVFDETYRGTYPFKEMMDLPWLMLSFRQKEYIWALFRADDLSCPDDGKIIGCILWVVDFNSRTAYNRGFNVLPRYQGKIGIADLSFSVYRKQMLRLKEKIDKWYNESRTAHSISQFMSHFAGAHTDALFLNKDYFMGKKESDAMMVAFFEDGLECRVAPEKLIPEAIPFYKRAVRIHDLSKDLPKSEISVIINPLEVARVLHSAQVNFSFDQHGYVHLCFRDEKTESRLTALHTPMVKNIEKVCYSASSASVFLGLLYLLKSYAKSQSVEYIEFFIRASDVEIQKTLRWNGMLIQGYVPGWMPLSKENEKEDAVVFAWTVRKADLSTLKLTAEGEELLDLMRGLDEVVESSATVAKEADRWDAISQLRIAKQIQLLTKV